MRTADCSSRDSTLAFSSAAYAGSEGDLGRKSIGPSANDDLAHRYRMREQARATRWLTRLSAPVLMARRLQPES